MNYGPLLPRRLRSSILSQQRIEVGVETNRKVVAPVVGNIVNRDRGGVGGWRRGLVGGVCESKTRLARRADPHISVGTGPLGAATAFGGVLPVRAVDFIARRKVCVSCASV